MSRARDIAIYMVNRSIDMSKEKYDERYLVDFVKLHKPLYLGQYCMLEKYNKLLFEDKIYAYDCGPYVEGVHFVPAKYGYSLLRECLPMDGMVRLSMFRIEIIEYVLTEFGMCSTDNLIRMTKRTEPYRRVEDRISKNCMPEITVESIRESAANYLSAQ